MTRRVVALTALSVGTAGALWVVASFIGLHSCGDWIALSCGGTDPELTRLIR